MEMEQLEWFRVSRNPALFGINAMRLLPHVGYLAGRFQNFQPPTLTASVAQRALSVTGVLDYAVHTSSQGDLSLCYSVYNTGS